MGILLEAYSGRNSNIMKAERALDLLIKEMQSGYNLYKEDYSTNKAKVINDSKHLKEVEKNLKKEFGFNSLSIEFPAIDIVHGNIGPHTIPSSFMLFEKNPDIRKANVYVFMDIQTVVYRDLTAAETMAIILHEIGHNIDFSAPTRLKAWYHTVFSYGMNPIISEVMRAVKSPINRIVDKIMSDNTLRKLIVGYQQIVNEVDSILRILDIGSLGLYAAHGLTKTLSGVHLGYYGERKSDSVAVKYGYGPELVTALNKLTQGSEYTLSERAIQSNPITGLAYDFREAMLMFILCLYAPHPRTINRAKNALYKLEDELKDPKIPAHLKKDIKREIKELEEIIEDMEKPSFKTGKYRLFTALTNRLLSGGKGRNRNILDLIHSAEKYES